MSFLLFILAVECWLGRRPKGNVGIIGNIASAIIDIFNAPKKPVVPDLPKLDWTKEQQQTAQGNLDVLPKASDLAGQVNKLNQDQLLNMLRAAIPGYDEIQKQIGSNISSQLKGELPADVVQKIQSNAALRAIGGGYAGSGLHGNVEARDLGLTSLDVSNKAIGMAESWIGSTPKAPMYDVSSMFLSPMQRIGLDVAQNENQWNREWVQNKITALPDPGLSAISSGLTRIDAEIMKAYSMGMTGGMSPGSTQSVPRQPDQSLDGSPSNGSLWQQDQWNKAGNQNTFPSNYPSSNPTGASYNGAGNSFGAYSMFA